MRFLLVFLLVMSFSYGCAKVRVGGTPEPIKLDISMRLDIYQHVEKDIDAIEGIVSGAKGNKKAGDKQGFLGILVSEAYAQEGLSPEVEQAAMRRKDRLADVSALEGRGVIGENKDGLLELRNPQSDASAGGLVAGENADRMQIYEAVARKNGTSIAEVQRLYSKRLQNNAPSGAPVQAQDGAWTVK
jgi:uncharacterized protein